MQRNRQNARKNPQQHMLFQRDSQNRGEVPPRAKSLDKEKGKAPQKWQKIGSSVLKASQILVQGQDFGAARVTECSKYLKLLISCTLFISHCKAVTSQIINCHMSHDSLINNLEQIAADCRIDIIRMIEKAGNGHPGGSLSVIDILVSLFFHEMKFDPANPDWEDRDHFVLSKGHGVPALYAVLAKKGLIPHEELGTLRQVNSRLQGHPDRVKLPLVEASTGSLGQGLSIAQGMAMGLKLSKKDTRVFCVIGDGESQEGQIWEAAMSAPRHGLNNLVVFLDNNRGQIDGHVEEIMSIRPIADKWRSFNWAVQEIDGHSIKEILQALENTHQEKEKPSLIWAKTVKGKGVSFMENVIKWHGIAPSKEEADRAVEEIRSRSKS